MQAYSLIEILVAVIIVGVIASIALANFGMIVEQQKAKEGEQIVLNVVAEQRRTLMENTAFVPFNPAFMSRIAMSQNFVTVGTSTDTEPKSSFTGVWRTGPDLLFISNVEGTISGGHTGKYVLYIQHGGGSWT